jgi:hypothetical protein
MKERYLDLMEKALSAYTDAHIQRYFDDVKTNGLKEHGFPRLTANIGILIAHGRRTDLLPMFIEMMSVCCKMFLRPYVKAANEFSVREVLCCIAEVEAAGVVDGEIISAWKADLAAIEPEACYDCYALALSNRTRNWAIFLAVSELFRQNAGLCRADALIDAILEHQMQWFDENGMYQDSRKSVDRQPIMYDMVTRGLCSLLLHFGYQGRYRDEIDGYLKRAAPMMLQMQSPGGEIPFGGRSNQYLHCEGWQAQIFEFEAGRYYDEGNMEMAAAFKQAAVKSVEVCEKWISLSPISHIKNRFPRETQFGCEDYGYFDKYMITAASNYYVAYLMCREEIPVGEARERKPYVLETSDYFHKVFAGAGDYQIEFDSGADPEYDANGLGRVQRAGVPSAICLALPFASEPNYKLGGVEPMAFSLCSALPAEGGWRFAAERSARYKVLETAVTENTAAVTLLCRFADGETVREHYVVDQSGVSITVTGEGRIGYALPAFCFDGEVSPAIAAEEKSLTVTYRGGVCRYNTGGRILDLNRLLANRNGHYRAFLAEGEDRLEVRVELT